VNAGAAMTLVFLRGRRSAGPPPSRVLRDGPKGPVDTAGAVRPQRRTAMSDAAEPPLGRTQTAQDGQQRQKTRVRAQPATFWYREGMPPPDESNIARTVGVPTQAAHSEASPASRDRGPRCLGI
jgi:hypothetical protein